MSQIQDPLHTSPRMFKTLTRASLSALLFLAAAMLNACSRPEPPMNVLLVTMDTTRADHIGAYGRDDATTPVLDGLAETGTLFERAISSNPITQPAHSTILTGVYPLMHGVRDNGLFHLPQELDTLAEMMAARGYRTGAAVGGFPLTREFGLDQGFQYYDDDLQATRRDQRGRLAARKFDTWYDERPAPHVNDAILKWLREPDDRPFFAWVHYWDPHEPHIAPPPFGEMYAHDPYQGEIAYADSALGALLRHLEATGELERTIIVVTSDHGEGHMEHGEMTHAFLAYESTLRVPLILNDPRSSEGRRIDQTVGTVDIVPTVMDLLDFGIPDGIQGRSLAAFVLDCANCAEPASTEYYAESLSPRLSHGVGELRIVYDGSRKFIHGPRPELYDLDADPGELTNLSQSRPEAAKKLQQRLSGLMDWFAGDLSAQHDFDAAVVEKLAGLGYLNMSGGEITTNEVLLEGGIAPQDVVGDINRIFQLRRLISSGRMSSAIPLARDLLERQPDNGYIRGNLALALASLSRFDESLTVIGFPPAADASGIVNMMRVAQWLYQDEQVEKALELADSLLAQQKSSPEAFTVAARLYRSEGDLERSRQLTKEALQIDPDDQSARLLAFEVALERAARGEAREHATRLVEQFPHHAVFQFALARAYHAEERFELAIRRARVAHMLEPQFCDAALAVPEWLSAAGDSAEADAVSNLLPSHCLAESREN